MWAPIRSRSRAADDEEDWYSSSLGEGEQLEVFLQYPAGADLDLQLVDPDGASTLTSTSSGTSDGVAYTVPVAGTYYVRVHYFTGSGVVEYALDTAVE